MANNSTNDFTQVFIKKKPVVTDWLQTDENCGETCLATVNDSVGTLLYKNLFQIVQYCIKKCLTPQTLGKLRLQKQAWYFLWEPFGENL
jgi:hypothetical protein